MGRRDPRPKKNREMRRETKINGETRGKRKKGETRCEPKKKSEDKTRDKKRGRRDMRWEDGEMRSKMRKKRGGEMCD